MRCYNCAKLSLFGFCEFCLAELSELSLGIRQFECGFKVYSFYKYSLIRHLLHSKHQFYGYFVLNTLAKLSFAKFKHIFELKEEKIAALALDDRVENNLYSHSALLTKHLKSKNIKPIFRALHSQNKVKYSGQSLDFRQKNKRNFKLLKKLNTPLILVDDIITTGATLLEAKEVLNAHNIEVLFGLVLADANE